MNNDAKTWIIATFQGFSRHSRNYDETWLNRALCSDNFNTGADFQAKPFTEVTSDKPVQIDR